jgi:putative oxidoreductase
MLWTVADLVGRGLMALLFVLAGVAKIIGPKPFLDHMAEQRVPGFLLPLVIALEIGGGLLVLIGWEGRYAALILAGFCVVTAVVFHRKLGDRAERTLFVKDLAIAGGLLVLAASYARAGSGL